MADATDMTTPEQEPQPQQQQWQHNVTCDECGVSPIVGMRYKATHIFDYDICSPCFHDNHTPDDDCDKFVAFQEPVDSDVASAVCLVADTGITAYSLEEAAGMIGDNDKSTSPVAKLWLGRRLFDLDDDDEGQKSRLDEMRASRLEMALATNTHLRIIYIHMCVGRPIPLGSFASIARGIARNRGLKHVFWHIGAYLRTETTATILRDMIATNTTLQAVYIGRACLDKMPLAVSDTRIDSFATIILEGLQSNRSITNFRLDSRGALSDKTKDDLVDIVKTNGTIRKMYLEFQYPDHRLDLLLACNRERWIARLASVDATNEELVAIFSHALHYENLDPVATAYHLLRSRPDLVG
jgi:Zinc finger, ZZ type